MKKIGFVGAYDKVNLIMYTAKILRDMNYRILVIDGTMLQKTRYIVPTVSRAKMYITAFEDIDFAVGFQNIEQIMQYLQLHTLDEASLPYDYVLMDVDNRVALKTFNTLDSEKLYFVTGFDAYSLKRGLDIFSNLEENVNLTKILFSNTVTNSDLEYLNYLSLECKITWAEVDIYFPTLDLDNRAIDENQRVEKLKVKKLSSGYQKALMYVVQDILDESKLGKIKKGIRE